MKKTLLCIFIGLCAVPIACASSTTTADDNDAPTARRNVASYFGDSRADTVFTLLSTVNRLDMVDYFSSGMTNPVENKIGALARITALSDSTIVMQYTPSVTTSVSILPGKKPLLMVIETFALPQKDSRIRIFNTDWTETGENITPYPLLDNWLTDAGRKNRADVEYAIPFMLSTAYYNPSSQSLTFSSTVDTYFGDFKPDELKYLKPSLTYRWTGKKFKLISDK